jgi:hypothetical protein
MVGEGTTAITVTFFLAIVGYAGLTVVVLLALRGKIPRLLWRSIAAVITAHVIMVWTFRYHWQFDLAVRNGYAGFIMFHGALAMILLSTVARERVSRVLIQTSFVVVSLGAVGASFLYDVVAYYRVPVVACALAGAGGLLWAYLFPTRARTPVS